MNSPRDRRTSAWVAQRSDDWRDLESNLAEVEDTGRIEGRTALRAVHRYPEVARDLALARRLSPDGTLARRLERIYARLHRSLYRPATNLRADLTTLFRREIPEIAHELRHRIVVVAAGFAIASAAGWWMVDTYPGLVGLFASPEAVERVQGGELWTDGLLNVMPSSVLSAEIFTNNILVSLTVFCLGAVYGLGTIYIIGMNGFMIGAVFAFTARHDLAGRLAEFIVAHGFVELSIIFIAGAAGFSLGEAIARPAHRTRTAAFRRAATRGARLMFVCCLFLVGAGLIEGYVSPNPAFPLPVRLAIGIAYWVVLLLALGAFGPLRTTSDQRGSKKRVQGVHQE